MMCLRRAGVFRAFRGFAFFLAGLFAEESVFFFMARCYPATKCLRSR